MWLRTTGVGQRLRHLTSLILLRHFSSKAAAPLPPICTDAGALAPCYCSRSKSSSLLLASAWSDELRQRYFRYLLGTDRYLLSTGTFFFFWFREKNKQREAAGCMHVMRAVRCTQARHPFRLLRILLRSTDILSYPSACSCCARSNEARIASGRRS